MASSESKRKHEKQKALGVEVGKVFDDQMRSLVVALTGSKSCWLRAHLRSMACCWSTPVNSRSGGSSVWKLCKNEAMHCCFVKVSLFERFCILPLVSADLN